MENVHTYSFPAVGSLKEKRLAHFAETPKQVQDYADSVDKAKDAVGTFKEARKEEKLGKTIDVNIPKAEMQKRVQDAQDRRKTLQTELDKISGLGTVNADVKSAVEKADAKMAEVTKELADSLTEKIEATGVKRVESVKTADPKATGAKVQANGELADLKNHTSFVVVKVLDQHAKNMAAIVEAAGLTVPDAAAGVVPAKPAGFEEDAYNDAAKPAKDADKFRKDLNTYDQAVRAKINGQADSTTNGTDVAGNVKALVAELGKIEAALARTKPTPATAPVETPTDLVKTTVDGIIKAKDNPAELATKLNELANKKLSEKDAHAVAGLLRANEDLSKKFDIGVISPAAGDFRVDVKPKGAPVEVAKENVDFIKQLIQAVIKLLGIEKILPPELKNALTTGGLEKHIKGLEEKRTELATKLTTDKTLSETDKASIRNQIADMDQRIAVLKTFAPLVKMAEEKGIKIDFDGKSLIMEPMDPSKVQLMQLLTQLAGKCPFLAHMVGNKLVAGLDPRFAPYMQNFAQGLPAVGYGPQGYFGVPNGGLYAGAGFDQFGRPAAQTAIYPSYDMGQKAYQGASNKRA